MTNTPKIGRALDMLEMSLAGVPDLEIGGYYDVSGTRAQQAVAMAVGYVLGMYRGQIPLHNVLSKAQRRSQGEWWRAQIKVARAANRCS